MKTNGRKRKWKENLKNCERSEMISKDGRTRVAKNVDYAPSLSEEGV